MARNVRIQYQGAIYHVMSRGNRREKICRVDRDRTEFQRALAEVCARTDWQIHAWVIMPNHFHLLVETPRANLVSWPEQNRIETEQNRTGSFWKQRGKCLGGGRSVAQADGEALPALARLAKTFGKLFSHQMATWLSSASSLDDDPPR